MIRELVLENIATYKNRVDIKLSKVNYFYGSNGVGKTTISNLISNPNNYESCEVVNDSDAEILVYNKNFVDVNFNDSNRIKGIFTFGNDSNDTLLEIENLNAKVKEIKEKIKTKKDLIEKKNIENKQLFDKLTNSVWTIKSTYQPNLKLAFEGKIKSRVIFAKEVLKLYKQYGKKGSSYNLDEITDKYNLLMNNDYKKIDEMDVFSDKIYHQILEVPYEIEKPIVGKEDLNITGLIKKLGHASWMKDGKKIMENNNHNCPFCNRPLEDDWIIEIEDYFDNNYEQSINTILSFLQLYKDLERKIEEDELIIYDLIEKLKISRKIVELDILLLKKQIGVNIKLIYSKLQKPETKIKLIDLCKIIEKIKINKNHINELIKKNNLLFEDKEEEIKKLIKQFWKCILKTYSNMIEDYEKSYNGNNKAIENSMEFLKINNNLLENYENEIQIKESEISGIKNSVQEINKILHLFGFNDFKLMISEDQKSYRIIRQDGTDVGKTLSEGEYRFISFLYFYQMIKGSHEKSGITKNKIIVIDDPISSLDSNILFIVSTLVKELIDYCLHDNTNIRQIILLTHNVYYHREIVYAARNCKSKKDKEKIKYYVIKKVDGVSNVVEFDENPINTTYELLWNELKPGIKKNRATIYNTMRRILEFYFNIIGQKNFESLINEFEGEEKVICKSLVACINDASHYISEDFAMALNEDDISRYEKVFQLIFEKLGHLSHYNMMMELD